MRFIAPLMAAAVASWPAPALADALLYSQDFEHPDGFVNDGGDINIFRTINQLYHDQPAGFVFSQTFTTETLLIGGTQAFGQGYKDPDGRGGQYVVSQLSDANDDRLGLAFNVGAFKFLNLRIDISGIDLDRFGGPFVPAGGAAPVYRFRLFDNPGGAPGVGSGTPLDVFDATAPFNPLKNSFLWTRVVNGLDASGSTNGNVILQIDVLSGGYAAFDNIVVTAADVRGGVPEPATWASMLAGFALLGATVRRRRSVSAAPC
jgi:hypothetical protein